MKKLNATDLLFLCGAGLVSVGIGLLACAAGGVIAAGAFCLLASFLSDGGGK